MSNLLFLATFKSTLDFFVQGGFFMVLLLICSFVAVAVIILRGLALRRDLVMPPDIENRINALQPSDGPEEVVKLARMVRKNGTPLARIVRVALHHLQWPKAENLDAVQTKARHEVTKLESGLFILEIIVGIAPLLGLLGAVSGLVAVFANLGASESVQDPRGIAKGISEALSTTIVGLAIAIPALIAHVYYSKKVETMATDMETLISDLLTKCYHQKNRYTTLVSRIDSADPVEETV